MYENFRRFTDRHPEWSFTLSLCTMMLFLVALFGILAWATGPAVCQ